MNTVTQIHTLRKHIREAKKQFRHNNDNSESIFHPAKGFVIAYDMRAVEEALDAYERSIATEYSPVARAS